MADAAGPRGGLVRSDDASDNRAMPRAASKPSSQPAAGKPGGATPAETRPSPARAPKSKPAASGPTPAHPTAAKAAKVNKARPNPTGALARPAKVEIQVDRAIKQQWEKAIATLKASKQKGAAAFDELWETVGEVVEHDPPLYLAGGFATAKAFLAAHFEETQRTAYRNVRVAKYASPSEEAKYGVAKLDLVLSYVEAKLGAPAKGRLPIDFASIRIPVRRNDEVRKVRIEEASAKEIAGATRELTRAAKKVPTFASPLVSTITKAFAKSPLRAITVRLASGKLSFGGVDPAAIPALALALSGLKLPES